MTIGAFLLAATFANPVLPADFSDIDCIRSGNRAFEIVGPVHLDGFFRERGGAQQQAQGDHRSKQFLHTTSSSFLVRAYSLTVFCPPFFQT